MPRLYGEHPNITQSPDQQNGLAVNLTPEPTPAPEVEAVEECSCDGVGIFWEDTGSETPGTYDVTSITFGSIILNEDSYPRAALVGDTCPGADLSGITADWEGGEITPTYHMVMVDQTWALVVTEIVWGSSPSAINGTLTVGGSIECGGETINVGPITFTIALSGGGPTPTPPS